MPEPDYEERYCAFIDVLGFSQLLSSLDSSAIDFQKVREVLQFTHYSPSLFFTKFISEGTDFRYQSISDAVCISTKPSSQGLGEIFNAVEQLSFALLTEGFFVRGAVVKGRLYHDEKTVFGTALVRAYQLEQNVVRYPRVMVTRDVVADVDIYRADESTVINFINCLGRGSDGPYYLHILSRLLLLNDEKLPERFRSQLIEQCNSIATKIEIRLDEAADTPAHFEKVLWFANYWNDSVPELSPIKRVFGAGVTPPRLPLNKID
jgi:hypothetical protein